MAGPERVFIPSPHPVSGIVKIILPDKTSRDLAGDPVTVEALARSLGFDPIEVMVVRNGTLVTEDAVVGNDDEVRIIRIAHGG